MQRGLARAVAHTFATIAVGQGAQILAGIATARAFGPAGKGVLGYAGILVLFAAAATEGVRSALAFRVARGYAIRQAWRVALTTLAPCAALGTAFFAVVWLADPTRIAFAYAALVFPFAAYLQAVNMLYLVRDAIERINVQNAWTIGAGSALATLVAVVVFRATVPVVLGLGLLGFVVASGWAALGARVLLAEWSSASAHVGENTEAPDPLSPRANLAFAGKGGASAIVTLLALRVDFIIVGATLATSALGIYAAALAVGELLYTFGRSVTWATTGRIATATADDAVALTARSVRVLLVTGALGALALAIAGPPAIVLAYGERFREAGLLLPIALPRIVLYSADGLLSYYFTSRIGRPGVQLIFELATLALCASLTYAGIARDGLIGATLGASVAFVVAFIAKMTYFARVTERSWSDVLVPRYDDLPALARRALARLGARA